MRDRDLRELADEYIVGLLSEEEALRVEARMLEDDDLAREVAQAAERFVEIDLSEPPAELSERMWHSISSRLDTPLPAQEAGGNVTPIRPIRNHANASVSGYWRPVAQAALAASFVLAAGLAWNMTRPQAQPDLIAVLVDANGEPQAIVDAFFDDRVTIRPLEAFAVPDGRTLQVWTLPDVPDAKPVSLGLLEDIGVRGLRGPDLPPPKPGQLYEITIEQAGGSPTGLPTGPIVGKGFAKPAI